MIFHIFCSIPSCLLFSQEKDAYRPDVYLSHYHKQKGRKFDGFNQQQLEVFRLLFEFRWRLAEANNEGFQYTMGTKIMLLISEKIPTDIEGIKKLCVPEMPPLIANKLEVSICGLSL